MANLEQKYNYFRADHSISDRMTTLEQVIDDTAGIGAKDKVWSADKIERLMKNALVSPHIYGCLWNQTDATMERIWDAKGITTVTTNFTYNGSVNPNYNNPFDDLMPWKGRKVCNVDLAAYKTMIESGTGKLTDCIKAYEGDASFDWNDADGVWVYTPEFWYTVYDREDGYRVFGVADGEVADWNHAPESIQGRTFGVDETRTVDGESTQFLLPKAGAPLTYVTGAQKLEEAQAYGGTFEDVYTLSEENVLYIVEFANMDSQAVLGDGVSDFSCLDVENGFKIAAGATNTNTIKVQKSDATQLDVNGLLYVGSSRISASLAKDRIITAFETDADDSTLYDVTFTGDPITVKTSHYWFMVGLANPIGLDSALGSKSGYLGVNGKNNSYYRGKVSHANRMRYILGGFRETSTNHFWVTERKDCDKYANIDKNEMIDTGIVWVEGRGYANKLACVNGFGQLPVATELGGTSAKPICDTSENATLSCLVLHVGALATHGKQAGRFQCCVHFAPSRSPNYTSSAVPCLKNPEIA